MLAETLETDRLRLRPYTFSDVDAVLSYAADPEWGRFLPVPEPYSRQDAIQFIAGQILLDPKEHGAWAIEYEGQVVGGIVLRLSGPHRLGELGYAVARRLWGQGIAGEAARAVIDGAFTALPALNRIRATADVRNNASVRVLEKVGLRREGLLRQNRFLKGEPVDEVWFGLLRDEWAAERGRAG